MTYKNLTFEVKDFVAHIALNRPDKANSLSLDMWEDIPVLFDSLNERDDVRVAIISGNGKHFCSGIDLAMFGSMGEEWTNGPDGLKHEKLRLWIKKLQHSFTAIERCRVPVIAAMHKACIGGAIDLTTACDLRYATDDAYFSIKEIDIGMVADVGTLQRLPQIIGDTKMRELAYTGRNFDAAEAEKMGFLNATFSDKDAMMAEVNNIACTIAAKSPLSIRGTKHILRYTRDHGVDNSLDYLATWNASMLLSVDLTEAMTATFEARTPKFANS